MNNQPIKRQAKIDFIRRVARGEKIGPHERFMLMDDKEPVQVWYCGDGMNENFDTGQKLTDEEFDKLYPDKSEIIDFREVDDLS
jgi:hypothetical protein